MERVLVIGCPGSGKSVFSRALHEKTGLPLVHLDLLFWNADRTFVSRELFLERLRPILSSDRWIIDGNYASTLELRMAFCDTVIFLDYPTEVCLEGALARRGAPRPDLPWVEDPGEKPDGEFLSLIRSYRRDERPRVLALLARHPDKTRLVFSSREEADRFLSAL